MKEAEMRMVVLGAAVGTLLLGAIPASAQVVVHDRNDVVVHRNYDRGHHYGWYRHHAECRTVRVRTRLPNGNVIIKTRRSCWSIVCWQFTFWRKSRCDRVRAGT